MKKNFILFALLLLIRAFGYAAPPTVPSSNLSFNSLDGAQLSATYTVGNGANRIIVMKAGSPVTGMPVNGIDYTANAVFGTSAAQFTAAGEYVVAKTGWNSFTATNLQPGTLYYVAVFEYNGSGSSTQFLTLSLTGSQSTVVAPTAPSYAISSSAITGNTLTLSWSKGNGSGRIVLAKKGGAVDAVPADLTNYWSDPVFGNGTQVGSGNYVIYKGTGNSVQVKVLEPNSTYYFSIFEYNGSVSPMHLVPGTTFSVTTNAGPTLASGAAGFSYVEGNHFTISVNQGNGNHRLFIGKKNAPVTAVPVNGVTYTANAAFGTPGTEIAPGEFVIGAITGNGVSMTNLDPNTTYHFRVYDYDADNAGFNYYLTGSYAVKSGSTATTPTTVASNLNMLSLTGSSATIGFTPGNGSYRMVLMKAGSAVDAVPANLNRYTPNSSFGSGAQLTPGNYVMHWGMNGSQFSVNNLQPGITYHVSIYEFNGNDAPVYSNTGATYSFTVPLEPTAAATAPWTALNEGNAFRLIWTNGTGAKRIVVAKKGSAVTAKPLDGVSYTANSAFGQGTALGAGEYVIYNGTGNSVDIAGLDIASTYHFAVYEYNADASNNPDYLTSTWLATTGSTVSWPTTNPVFGAVSNLQSSSATINFTKGNGASRLFVMKQGSPVDVAPLDLSKYNYSSSFGAVASLISGGNYVVMSTGGTGSFGVTGLQPNTTYYVSAFEFNGTNAPAYLVASAPVTSFTTPDVAGATVPTMAASGAVISNVDGNKFTLKWTNGNGEKRIVVMRKGAAVNFVPASAASYTANAAFGNGTDLGGEQYVIFNGNGNTVDISNLLPSSNYYFTVYEYNGTGSLIRYLTSPSLAANTNTAYAPTIPSSNVNTVAASGQVTLNWTSGNGSSRLIVMKQGSAVLALPADQGVYPANATFGQGAQIGAAEYVVYAGAGSSVTVTGLQNSTYYFSIFEYNGSTAPVYNTMAVLTGSAVASVVLPVKLLSFKAAPQGNNVQLTWATSNEINFSHFVIQGSTDGNYFSNRETVMATGSAAAVNNYQFNETGIATGAQYYRLQLVDRDGKTSYSPVIKCGKAGREPGLQDAGAGRIRVIGAKDQWIAVYEASGRLLHKEQLASGDALLQVILPRGIYAIRVNGANSRLLLLH